MGRGGQTRQAKLVVVSNCLQTIYLHESMAIQHPLWHILKGNGTACSVGRAEQRTQP
jgi:hypothetical protein